MARVPREELAGQRVRDPHRRRSAVPSRDDVPAVLAGARPDVDDVVGRAHRLLVVLDDDHACCRGRAGAPASDQPLVVALVQADRRLVEDVEHADQRRADLRRQADPLRLAAGERRRRAVHRQVVEADVVQEAQPLVDLVQDQPRDVPLRSPSAPALGEPLQRARALAAP